MGDERPFSRLLTCLSCSLSQQYYVKSIGYQDLHNLGPRPTLSAFDSPDLLSSESNLHKANDIRLM
jgi:hypothetical protein